MALIAVAAAFVGAAPAAAQNRTAYVPNGLTGRHRFAVRAIDTAGNVDPKPDKFAWTVTRD